MKPSIDLSKLPKPYYQDDDVVIYCADCRDILPLIPDKSVDLVLTSPPYDDLRVYGGHKWDFPSVANKLPRILQDGGVLVWVVNDSTIDGSESCTSFKHALFFRDMGLNLHDTMIYEKNGPAYPSFDKYYQVFEYMFIFSKGKPKTTNLLDDRPNRWYGKKFSKIRSRRNREGKLKVQTWLTDEGSDYGIRFNIWRYNVGAGYSSENDIAYEHPAIFPIQLARDHILSWSKPNDIILDPLVGSGTVLWASKELNRKCIGIEIEEKYCEIAAKRCSQSVMRLDIEERWYCWG